MFRSASPATLANIFFVRVSCDSNQDLKGTVLSFWLGGSELWVSECNSESSELALLLHGRA